MAGINFEKLVSALPGTLTPNTVYFVRSGQGFDTWLSNSDGTEAFKSNGGISAEDPLDSFLLMGVGGG